MKHIVWLSEQDIHRYRERRWISTTGTKPDEEDLARARLIKELIDDFGVNDEAVPLILALVDRLNCICRRLR